MARVLTYAPKDTWIHRLSGVTKMIFFLLWSIAGMLTYDTRVLAVMLAFSLVIFKVSKTEWKQVGTVFKFILFFLFLNLLTIFLFSPFQGTEIYGTKTVLFHIAGHYSMTTEQLFYEFNIMLKYFTVVPVVLMFMVTTNPSELAASMNRLGISYNIGYSIAIALRYVPDVQADFSKMGYCPDGRNISISRVLHKTHIDVDGLGTKAGAATVVEMCKEMAMVEQPERIILDRPFLYAIVEKDTGIPVFIGTVESF